MVYHYMVTHGCLKNMQKLQYVLFFEKLNLFGRMEEQREILMFIN